MLKMENVLKSDHLSVVTGCLPFHFGQSEETRSLHIAQHARSAIFPFSDTNFANTSNSSVLDISRGNYAETVGCVYLPKTRTSTERCDVKLCLFLAVQVYVP